MELLGRTLRSEFLGLGTVKSFDSTSGLFEIVYEGGDSEEMNFEEVVAALDEAAEQIRERPKKRRRGESVSGGDFVKDGCSREGFEGTNVRDCVIDGRVLETLGRECERNGELDGNVCCGGGLDLNVNIRLDDSLEKDCFDDGNDKGSDLVRCSEGTHKIKHSFDVNIRFDEEIEETQNKVSGIESDVKKDYSLEDESERFNGDTQVKATGACSENDARLDGCEGIQNEARDFSGYSSGDASRVFGTTHGKDSSGAFNEFNSSRSSLDVICVENHGDGNSSDPPDKEEQGRKKRRRRRSENLKPAPQAVLRRSSRRLSAAPFSANDVSSVEKFAVNAGSLPSEINVVPYKKSFGSYTEGVRDHPDLPPKLELPASSKNLDIDEISILDLFSIYACLRSFSTILFLSPFELEAFVEALKENAPNSLIDSIHFSLLQALKLHLEFLSSEGSQYASTCLRSLNWGLLDLVTWPMYMVEYLLIRGSELKPGFELIDWKLLIHDYYNQLPSIKVEILRCLCDDVLEAETVRLELNRRTVASEPDIDGDRNADVEISKKRKDYIDNGVGSCLTQDVVDETNDWNSDECCLCKMDGILICCDGCPAAYHTSCVGITKELLPEGDWYCPECVINRYCFWMKSPKSLRGAELLGTDPHGRIYFSTCGYLLVLDSCDPDSPFYYYKSDDLDAVIEILKSSDIIYDGIIRAITVNWNIPADSNGAKGPLASQIKILAQDLNVDAHISVSSAHVQPLEENEIKDVEKPDEILVVAEDVGTQLRKVSESATGYDSTTTNQLIKTEIPFGKCERVVEISQADEGSQTYERKGAEAFIGTDETFKKLDISEETSTIVGDSYLKHTDSDPKQPENLEAAASGQTSDVIVLGKGTAAKRQNDPSSYVNYYTFAQTAASVAQELMHKSSDTGKDDSKRSAEEIISAQMKVISKRSLKFCWPNLQSLDNDAQKENCGWCFSCRTPTESDECLFNLIDKKPAPEASKSRTVGPRSKRNQKSHLYTVICYILSIEERLSGLLSGPWQNPQYSKNWRKCILKATDVASVKHLLLILESNLRRIALSADWLKQVDSFIIIGSASHVWTSSDHISSSKHGGGKKRARFTDGESNSVSASRSPVFWWRGGRLSRQLFHWKVLPHSLASKGGRQAGCRKIAGVLYPDGLEFAKRSRYIAWRASVEMSTSIVQLACQVRELDSCIRWDDLENTKLFSHLPNESRKVMKLFKKVIIRRKCTEGTNVKYLLDFGKRKIIPDTVVRNGIMLEVSASERKKYWLDESLVPLHILRSYEEKKLSRVPTATKPGLLDETYKGTKSSSRKMGLVHLLAKSEKSEYYQCGHCKKDVLVRDAVNCQDCEGFFHKRHARKSEPTNSIECTYTCRKCQEKKYAKKPAKGKPKKGRGRPKKSKKPPINERPKRLAARKVKYVALRSKKRGGVKKGKRAQSKKAQPKKSKEGVYKKKRSRVYHTYWSNGLQLTRKPNDARVASFTERKLVLPSRESSGSRMQPTCSLCSEAGYKPRLIYVNCELCQEWFHGDAFGITFENCCNILGFRCHSCCKRKLPMCPYSQDIACNEIQSHLAEDRDYAKDVSVIDGIPSKKFKEQIFSLDDGSQFLLNRNESVQDVQKTDSANLMNKELNIETNLDHTDKEQKTDSIADAIEQKACSNPDSIHEQNAEKYINSDHINHNENDLPDSKHEGNTATDTPDSTETLMFGGCQNGLGKGIEYINKEQKDNDILDEMQEQKADSIRNSNHILMLEPLENDSGKVHVVSCGSFPEERY